MGMSTHIIGFRPPDEKWQRMYKVWRVCQENDIETPDEVQGFFDYETPDAKGIEVELCSDENAYAKKWSETARDGYEVCIKDLPDNITHIRFYNAW